VRWYREKAAVERLKEELDMLDEEFRRTYKSFMRMTEVWKELAILNQSAPGYSAYAWRQVNMHIRFAEECWSQWKR
jgi:hypothetical protein